MASEPPRRLAAIVAKHLRRLRASPAITLDANGQFVCPRYRNVLTLSPAFCGRLFERARAALRNRDEVQAVATEPCQGCRIGALHAGLDQPPGACDETFVPGQGLFREPRDVRQRRSRNGARISAENSKQRAAGRRQGAR